METITETVTIPQLPECPASDVSGAHVLGATSSGQTVKIAASGLSAIQFDDIFTLLAGTWGSIDHTHMENGEPASYCLNGLWLTYEEAMLVVATHTTDAHLHETYAHVPVRTVIPHSAIWVGQLHRTFELNKSVEVVVFNDFRVDNATFPFYGCTKLKRVEGLTQIGNFTWGESFKRCPALETLKINGLRSNIDVSDSPLLSLASLAYLVENRAAPDKNITITVSSDAYTRWETETDMDNWGSFLSQKNVILAQS